MTAHCKPGWGLLTPHAKALIAIAADNKARISDVAAAVGLTERMAFTLINDLDQAGYISRKRVGRNNEYTVHVHEWSCAHLADSAAALTFPS